MCPASDDQLHKLTMVPSRLRGSSKALTYLLLAAFFLPSNALYFYIGGSQAKCFFEELPKDTLVVGETLPYRESKLMSRRLMA